MLAIKIRERMHVVILDSAGQPIGLIVANPGKTTVKQKVVKSIRRDLDNFEAIVKFLQPAVIFIGDEIAFNVNIADDKNDKDPTVYTYYLKQIELF